MKRYLLICMTGVSVAFSAAAQVMPTAPETASPAAGAEAPPTPSPLPASPAAPAETVAANPAAIPNNSQATSPKDAMPNALASSPTAIGGQVLGETAADAASTIGLNPATPVNPTAPGVASVPPAVGDAAASPAVADAAATPPGAVKPPIVSAPVKLIPAEPEGPPIFTNTSYRSLLFRQNEIDRIKEATEAYKFLMLQRKLGRDIVADVVAPAQPTTKILEHPQFYLSSIVFHNTTDWSVWINGLKYTSQSANDGDLIVQDVDKEKARIIWRPRVFGDYKDKLPVSAPRVSVDEAEGTVTFTLFPNQTFSAFTMKIHEGMLPPVYREQITIQPAQRPAAINPVRTPGLPQPAAKLPAAPAPAATESMFSVGPGVGRGNAKPDSTLPQAELPPLPVFQPATPPGAANR